MEDNGEKWRSCGFGVGQQLRVASQQVFGELELGGFSLGPAEGSLRLRRRGAAVFRGGFGVFPFVGGEQVLEHFVDEWTPIVGF